MLLQEYCNIQVTYMDSGGPECLSWLVIQLVSVHQEPSVLPRLKLHVYMCSITARINRPVASVLLNHEKPASTGKQRRVCDCKCVSKEEVNSSRMYVNVDLLQHCLPSVPNLLLRVNIHPVQTVRVLYLS